ncbi:calcium-transporting ATPase 4, plasma membrane-type protein [Tanacetum coccineum]
MASPQASICKPSKKPKFTIIPPKQRPKINIIPPKQLFVDLTQDDTKTPSPKLQLSSPSAPNAPSKTPSTKDTSSSSIDYIPKSPTSSNGSAPLTVVQLLWVNLIMDILSALALATKPPNEGLMKRPTVKRSLFLIYTGQMQLPSLIPSYSTPSSSVSSWIFMVVMIATVVFQVIIVEFLGTFASIVPLEWKLWVLSIVIGLVSMPIVIVLKCIPVEKKRLVSEQHEDYVRLPNGPEQV